MTKLIEDLLALQSLLRLGDATSPAQKAQIEALRAGVPEPILAHFLRQVAAGRKGIAVVRNGVCGECHLRVSHAMNQMLGKSNELLVCENCGTFLAASPEQPALLSTPAPVQKLKRRRVAKKLAAVVDHPPILSAAGVGADAAATDTPLKSRVVAAPAPNTIAAA